MDIFPKQFTYDEARGHLTYCDSYSRLPTLLEMSWLLDDTDFFRILGEEWSGFDNLGHYADELWDTPFMWWDHNGPIKKMMTQEELDAYNALPDVVTVYRGCYKINKWGLVLVPLERCGREISDPSPVSTCWRATSVGDSQGAEEAHRCPQT